MGRKRKTDKHLPERMYLKSGSYYFVDFLNKWHNLGREFRKALAKYGQLADPDRPCKTIADLTDRYIAEVAPTKADSSYKNNIRESKFIKAGLGHILIEQLKPQVVYQYLDARKNTPSSANRELALLSHMYRKAIRWGYTDYNPCFRIEKFKEKPRDRYIENWEYYAFRDFAGPLIGAYMDFKYLTGLRKGDILQLKRSQITDDGIHITIRKTRKMIVIEWTPLLRESVENIRRLKRPVKGLYLFNTRRGQPYSGSGFSSIWQRKMRAAIREGVIKERFRDHDLRAKTASDIDLDHAFALLGHEDKKTTQKHYERKAKRVMPLR